MGKIILKVTEIESQPVRYEDFPHKFFIITPGLVEFGDESLAETGWQVPAEDTGDARIWLEKRVPGYEWIARQILLTYTGASFAVEDPDGCQEIVRVVDDDDVYDAILRNTSHVGDAELEFA